MKTSTGDVRVTVDNKEKCQRAEAAGFSEATWSSLRTKFMDERVK